MYEMHPVSRYEPKIRRFAILVSSQIIIVCRRTTILREAWLILQKKQVDIQKDDVHPQAVEIGVLSSLRLEELPYPDIQRTVEQQISRLELQKPGLDFVPSRYMYEKAGLLYEYLYLICANISSRQVDCLFKGQLSTSTRERST